MLVLSNSHFLPFAIHDLILFTQYFVPLTSKTKWQFEWIFYWSIAEVKNLYREPSRVPNLFSIQIFSYFENSLELTMLLTNENNWKQLLYTEHFALSRQRHSEQSAAICLFGTQITSATLSDRVRPTTDNQQLSTKYRTQIQQIATSRKASRNDVSELTVIASIARLSACLEHKSIRLRLLT